MTTLIPPGDKAASASPGIDSRFENGKRGWMALDNSVTFSDYTGPRHYRREAKQIWAQLDANKDACVDQQEIASWLLENNVFKLMSVEDSRGTINKLFREIDKDGNGTLDFEEFNKFYKMVQQEKSQMLHASRHHITALPNSIVKYNKKAFTTEAIETLLQEKIQQYTSQDTDRFRQIFTMFKTQVQRAKDHDNERKQVMGVSKRQFGLFLMWLGLFATKDQADVLFDKYDMNGDGVLTVHEFLTKARPRDYPGRAVNVGEKYSFRTGKRMYLNDTLVGKPVRPTTPTDHVYHVSEKTIADRIRTKMGNQPGVGPHFNETPLALNDLLKVFLYYDKEKKGFVTQWQLKRALENLNLSMGETHLELLMDKFNVDVEGELYFKYPEFCIFVYPGKPSNASLPRHTSLQLRKPGYGNAQINNHMSLDFSGSGLIDKHVFRKTAGSGRRATPGKGSARRTPIGTPIDSARSVKARLSHTQRLQPLNDSGRRTLTPSASMAALPRSGSGRTMGRSASTPQFAAPAFMPNRPPGLA